jgi:hypothetical protein
VRNPRSAAVVFGTLIGATLGFTLSAAGALATPTADVMIDPGPGWTLVAEQPGDLDSLVRTYQGDAGILALTAIPVTTPPGVRTMFDFLSDMHGPNGVPEDSLDLAEWTVAAGSQLDNGSSAELTFAARDYLFIFAAETGGAVDPLPLLRELAQRQVAAVGGPAAAETETAEHTEAESELVAMLPTEPPDGYGLSIGATITGSDELTAADDVDLRVAEFLNDHSTTAARLWASTTLAAAVSITRYPYEIFAAASVHEATRGDDREVISEDALPDVPDVVAYRGVGDSAGQIGTSFRRGDVFVIVLTQYTGDVSEETAGALAADLTRLTAEGLPAGGTTPYEFPSAPSKLLGLAFTAAIVTAAACGSALIARLRARTVRRQWVGGELPPPETGDPAHAGTAIALDEDADRLRRQGGVIAVGQILAVNVGIVALAGDFGWPGVIVAAAALVAGLLLTHWWQRRELGLVGAKAPPRELVIPRPAGAIVGVLSLAVLGFGVAFLLKGLRYIFLKPTLAQLKWSDWFGVAPRTVGVIFAIGGFLVAILGGWLFRLARALSRAGTRRRLELDPRPAALYLRSFQDDNLPLPVIASARRPLFELFSLRGSDPFEESMAWELNSYGPVVAVGRPGRSLASLGAAREHLPDATWREQVAARMDQAGMIAVATGETDGLAWELGQVVSGGHIGKTFFVFPPVAPAELGRRWDHTAASLEHAGQAVGPLPVPVSRIHTVRLDTDGTATVTYASRRDEATYRTAVDRIVTSSVPAPAPALAPTPAPDHV